MKDLIERELIPFGKNPLTFGQVITAALILLGAWILLRLIRAGLRRRWGKDEHGAARSQSVHQLVSYFLWTIAIAMALEALGIQLTIFLAGSAALLVGIGLGLQQTFNDIFSGIIILLEGTIKVGDVMEVDGLVGRVSEISLRTTKVLSRDDIRILVPNHKFINENVVNWSHTQMITRFIIGVGVAYSSDAPLVRKVLIDRVRAHPQVLSDDPDHPITVRLVDFGNSSLDFEVLFYSRNGFRIETTKSDIRFAILEAFRENGITIPFPQRDVHIIPPKM